MRGATLAVLALALSCAPKNPKYEMKIPDRRATLKNGMRVIILPDTTTDLIEVDVRYEVGSNEDPKGKEGLAHLVEHLMFQQRPAGEDKPELAQVMRELSIYYNAYTTNDSTHYQILARKEAFEDLVAIEATRLYTGCNTIPVAQFEREREVVRNEMRWRIGNPEGQVGVMLLSDIYPAGHPYSREIGGDDASVSSITLEDVCKFMNDYYVPERATLIVAGNVTEARAQEVVGKWLTELPARKGAPRVVVPPIELQKKRVEHELDVEETTVFVAWKLPPQYTDEYQAAGFLMGTMAGQTSRFAESWEFATDVGVFPMGGPHAPVMVLAISLRDPDDVDKALDFVWKSARTAHWGLDESEFETLRAQLKGDLPMQLESLPARTNLFGDYAQFDREQKFFIGEMERIDHTTAALVRRVTEKTLDPDRAVVVVVKSKRDGEGKYRRAEVEFSGAEDEQKLVVDKSEAVQTIAVPERSTTLADARQVTLGNGMRVLLLPTQSSLPVVTIGLQFNVGSAHDPADKVGLASIAASHLQTDFDAGWNGVEDAIRMSRVGVGIRPSVTEDRTLFTARGLNIYLDVVLKGLERVVRVGGYTQESIERAQRQFGFAMKRKSFRSRIELARRLEETVYGADHPYASTAVPTPESYGRIGRDAAYDFAQTHYSAANATLIVTGNFDADDAERMIRDVFGGWSKGDADAKVKVPARPRDRAVYSGVEGEESAAINVQIAYPGPVGIDENHAARVVLAEMLSQRMATLRETLGSSYGVRASYDARVGPGMYVISGPIDAERAGESLAAMRGGIESLRMGDKFLEDFVMARRLVLERLLGRANDSLTLMNQLSLIALHDLPLSYYDRLVRDVAAMTPQKVMHLLSAELKAQNEVVLAVGPKDALSHMFTDAAIQGAQIVEQEK